MSGGPDMTVLPETIAILVLILVNGVLAAARRS